MLDQNTTTVITTIITVIGTLGGAISGVMLSNYQSFKQEKAKRNAPIIEEAYTLINQLDDIVDECLREDKLLISWMKEKADRLRTLINLYLRSVEKEYITYSKAHWKLMTTLRDNEGRYHEDSNDNDFPEIESSKIYWSYKAFCATLIHSLEKLVD